METSAQIQELISRSEKVKSLLADIQQNADELLAGLKLLHETVPASTTVVFGQQNPIWSKDFMGTGGGTIGRYGCLMCCLASILANAGYDTDPRRLNNWLNKNGGYQPGSANLASFSSIEFFNVVKLIRPVLFTTGPVPFDKISATIRAGGYATIMVDFNGQPHTKESDVAMHWVRWLDDKANIMDPWLGQVMPLSPRYGKDANSAIWRVALYNKM